MSYDFKSESEVKEFIKNLGIEYRFGCYSEKKPEVCHLLGDYLEAVQKDYGKAGKLYKNNCEEYKFGKSCYKYGNYNLLGKGDLKANFKTAYSYFDQGCELGEIDSCFHQGLLLVTSNESGIEKDVPKGMSLLERACAGKNANACYYLSGMFISGVRKGNVKLKANEKIPKEAFEVQPDMEKAFNFALNGCKLRNMYSCVNLSQMYSRGEGVPKNQELADHYKNVALELQKEALSNKTLTFQEGLT